MSAAVVPVYVSRAERSVADVVEHATLTLRIGVFCAPWATVSGASWAPVPVIHVPSVNVVWATKPDAWPTAVTVNVRPRSSMSGENWVATKLPAASATVEYVTSGLVNGDCLGGHQASWRLIRTVSPGCQWPPEISTGDPG